MYFSHWMNLKNWLSSFSRTSRYNRRPSWDRSSFRTRLAAEQLEDRIVPSATLFRSLDVQKPITDGGTTTSTLQVANSLTIGDVNVTLNIVHPRAADLDVFLIAPDMTRIELFTDVAFPQVGGNTPFKPLTLDDQADVPVTDAAARFVGRFRSEGPLSSLIGSNAQGTWTLEVTDDTAGQSGFIADWSLTITNQVSESEVNNTIATADVIDASATALGSLGTLGDEDFYTFTVAVTGRLEAFLTQTAGSNVDPRLTLFGPDGRELVRSDDVGAGSVASVIDQHLTAGTYQLRVSSQQTNGPGTVGNYRLLTVFTDALIPAVTMPAGPGGRIFTNVDVNADGFDDLLKTNTSTDDASILLSNGDGSYKSITRVGIGNDPIAFLATDLNGDGRIDLIASELDGTRLTLRFGNGDGTFQSAIEIAVGNTAREIVAADIDGDLDLDLLTVNSGGNNVSVIKNNGNGMFATTNVLIGSSPLEFEVIDLDLDDDLDVVTANPGSSTLSILLNDGFGVFTVQTSLMTGFTPVFLSAVDVTGDSRPELFASNLDGDSVSVFLNTPTGFIAQNTLTGIGSPRDPLIGDLNGDEKADLIVASAEDNEIAVYLGNGNGTFQFKGRSPVGDGPLNAGRLVDIDDDEILDLVIANHGSQDISVLLGVGDGTFRPQRRFLAQSTFEDFLVLDLDYDGNKDIAIMNGVGSVSTLLGNGGGDFTRIVRVQSGNGPAGVTTADFNNDGRPDLLAPNPFDDSISVLLGNGDGSFQPQINLPAGVAPQGAQFADLNRDGRLDVIAVNEFSDAISVYLNNGDGTFQDEVRYGAGLMPRAPFILRDLNRDTYLDVVVTNSSTDRISLLLGNPEGTFRPPVSVPVGDLPQGVVTGDFDGDGLLDLAVANDAGQSVTVLFQQLDGSFLARPQPLPIGSGVNTLVAADLNGDGKDDLIVPRIARQESIVFLSDATGPFAVQTRPPTGDGVGGIFLVDVNSDQRLDLVTINITEDDVSVLLRNVDGTFQAQRRFDVGRRPSSSVVRDVDGDGLTDILVVNDDEDFVSLLQANGSGGYNHLQLQAGANPRSVSVSDLNRDGLPDIAIANQDSDDFTILLGQGGGFFSPLSERAVDLRHTPLIGDVNGDTILDTVVLNDAGKILYRQGLPGASNQFAPPLIVNTTVPARDIALLRTSGGMFIAASDIGSDSVSIYALSGSTFTRTTVLPTGQLPQRLGSADLDDNGRDDLVVAGTLSENVTLFLQQLDGNFSAPLTRTVGVTPSEITFANLDGVNGIDILVSSRSSGDVTVLYNDAGRTFSQIARFRAGFSLSGTQTIDTSGQPLLYPRSREEPVSLITGLFTTDDNVIDVVVLNRVTRQLHTLTGNVNGGLSNPQETLRTSIQNGSQVVDRPGQVVTGLFDNDTLLDIAVLIEDREEVWLYKGTGEGTFTLLTTVIAGNAPTGLNAADINNDGKRDLIVGNGFGDVLFILGNGDGTFRPFVRADKRVPFVTADLDGDQNFDVVVAQQGSDQARSLIRDPNAPAFDQGDFDVDAENGLVGPGDVALADLDGQFGEDLIFANTGSNNVLVYLRKADGSFDSTPQSFFTGTSPTGLHVTQLNDDNNDTFIDALDRPDLVVANEGSNDVSILLGATTVGGAWTFTPGPRLETAGGGPTFVTTTFQDADNIPDIIAVSSQGGTATLLPGVGDGFFNDTNPQTLNFGSSVLDLSGAFALLGDGRVVGFNFAAGITTLFTADAGREGNAIQAATLGGFAFPLLFTANDDGTVSALGSLDGVNYREVASATGDLNNPSALAVLQAGNDVEVYVSDTGESDLVVLSFGTEDLVAGLASVGGSLALVATLTNSLDNTTVSSLVVQTLLEDFSSAIDAELVFGGEDAVSESGPSDSVLASLLEALLDAGGNAEAETEFVSLTEESAIEPMTLQQFITGLKDALRDAGWKREEDADRVGAILKQMDPRDVETLLRRGQEVIDKIVIYFRAWSKQANAPTMRELPMTPPNEMAPVPDREEEISNDSIDEFFSASDFDRWSDSEIPWNSPESRGKGNEEASIGSLLSTLSSAVFASWVQRTPSYRPDSTKKRLLARWS